MPFPMPIQTTSIYNHFWQVGDDATQVYSSQQAAYVPVTDAGYVEWSIANKVSIIDARTLYETLIQLWLPSKFAAGITVSSTSTPALNGTYPLDTQSQQYITSISTSIAAGKGLPGGGDSFMYYGHPFDSDRFLTFASACQDYAYGLVQSLGQIVMAHSGSLPSDTVTIA